MNQNDICPYYAKKSSEWTGDVPSHNWMMRMGKDHHLLVLFAVMQNAYVFASILMGHQTVLAKCWRYNCVTIWPRDRNPELWLLLPAVLPPCADRVIRALAIRAPAVADTHFFSFFAIRLLVPTWFHVLIPNMMFSYSSNNYKTTNMYPVIWNFGDWGFWVGEIAWRCRCLWFYNYLIYKWAYLKWVHQTV